VCADDGRLGPGRRTGVSGVWKRAGGSISGSEGRARAVSGLDVTSSECLQGPGDDSELLELRDEREVQVEVGELSNGASSNSVTLVKGAWW